MKLRRHNSTSSAMMSVRASTAVGALALGLAVSLSGCAAAGAAGAGQHSTATQLPSPAISTSPTPEASADPIAEAMALVVRPEALEFVDADGGVLLAVSYEAPAAEMVDSLTAVIGSAPETREHDGGLESPPGVYYEWPGLTVSDPEPVDGLFPGLSNLMLSVSAPSAGGIESITTEQGYAVGAETAPILLENDWTVPEYGAFNFPAEFGPELGAASGDNPAYPNAWAVSINAESQATVIMHIVAPVNFGVQGH